MVVAVESLCAGLPDKGGLSLGRVSARGSWALGSGGIGLSIPGDPCIETSDPFLLRLGVVSFLGVLAWDLDRWLVFLDGGVVLGALVGPYVVFPRA